MYDVLVACSYFFVHSDSMSVFFLEMIGTRNLSRPYHFSFLFYRFTILAWFRFGVGGGNMNNLARFLV